MRFCVLIATSIVDIVIAIIASCNSTMDNFCSIFELFIFTTIIQWSCTNSQSIFSSIMILLNEFFDIFIILAKFVTNCIVALNNCCGSYYKFLCLHCCLFKHSRMTVLSINQCELIIHDTIEIVKQHFKDANDKHGKKTTGNDRNIQSHRCVRCTSMDYILMLIVGARGTKYSFYELIDHLYIHF